MQYRIQFLDRSANVICEWSANARSVVDAIGGFRRPKFVRHYKALEWPSTVYGSRFADLSAFCARMRPKVSSRSSILLRAERFAVPTTSLRTFTADRRRPLRIGRDLFSERVLHDPQGRGEHFLPALFV